MNHEPVYLMVKVTEDHQQGKSLNQITGEDKCLALVSMLGLLRAMLFKLV